MIVALDNATTLKPHKTAQRKPMLVLVFNERLRKTYTEMIFNKTPIGKMMIEKK
jgi:hypothetical protein